jgi:hypothetical protein
MSPDVGHQPDMPTALRNVRCWENSGKHLLAASISPFDPEPTFWPVPTLHFIERRTSGRFDEAADCAVQSLGTL